MSNSERSETRASLLSDATIEKGFSPCLCACVVKKDYRESFHDRPSRLAHNAAGRAVPSMVNGKPQMPYLGIGKYQPRVRKQAPPVRSSKDYPENGDKRLPDIDPPSASVACATAW